MRLESDRREHARGEIVGALWGQLERCEPVLVRNVSVHGVLVESPVLCAVGSEQLVQVEVEGEQVLVDARVRNVQPMAVPSAHGRYAIGLEFIAPPLSVVQQIEQLQTEPA